MGVIVDMSHATYPLTRDVFLVFLKRFPRESYTVILPEKYQVDMAKSLGIDAILAGIDTDFEKEFDNTHLLKHNFTMWEYFLYELRR
jgi:hypothetical protein